MNFHIDMDDGYYIAGWLIPDNPSDVPEFILKIADREEIPLVANVLRTDIRDFGLHETGMVGFHFDDVMVPDLSTFTKVSVLEAESRLTIYGRFDESANLRKKVMMLDAGGFPRFRTIRQLGKFFTLSYPMIERFSLETVGAIIGNQFSPSVVISGQLNWQRLGTLTRENDFTVTALLQDPFEELAERLMFISLVLRRKSNSINNSALVRHAPLFPLIEQLDLSNRKSVLSAFRHLTPEQRRLIRSPMTHMFACAPEEEPNRRSVSTAIDNLAQLDAVGTHEQFSFYTQLVNSVVEAPLFNNAVLDEVPDVGFLKESLQTIGLITDMLDEDIALYSFVRNAVGIAADKDRHAADIDNKRVAR